MAVTSRTSVLLVWLVSAAAVSGCDGASPQRDGSVDAEPDGGDADGDADGDSDGDADADLPPPPCEPGTLVCHDDAVTLCGVDGAPGDLVRDCTAAPFDGCAVGSCAAMGEPDGGCCFADEPFCHATVEVEGKAPISVDYGGFWDDEFACAGSIAEDGYNWSLWAAMPACTGPFVRVIVAGYLPGWEAGSTYPLCRDGTTPPDILISLTADETAFGNDDPAAPPDEACQNVTGSITFHEYGAAGEPFHISIDGVLFAPATGETRAITVDSQGVLLRYPS